MLEELLHKYGVKADIDWVAQNPNMQESFSANHYRFTFHIKDEDGAREFVTYFSMGTGLKEKPTPTMVVDSLMQDMYLIKDGLDDFIANIGYTHTKGKKVFDAIETETQKLFNFFGFNKFREIRELYEEEEV